MEIIAHRGYWIKEQEQNNKVAFERAFDNCWGIETDLRDICGKIVVSHNMPKGNEMSFEELLQLMSGKNLMLALNIKADGLADEIYRLLKKYNHTNYFCFDMSISEMVYQHKLNLKIFTGISDIMPNPVMFEKAQGVWLDSFNSDWFSEKEIKDLKNKNKKICIVSPDLHNRQFMDIWKRYEYKKPYVNFNSRFAPEQYMCISFVKQHFKDILFDDLTDWNENNMNLSNNILYSNFIFLGYKEAEIYSDKHWKNLELENFIKGLITYKKFVSEYIKRFDKDFDLKNKYSLKYKLKIPLRILHKIHFRFKVLYGFIR